MKLMILIQTTIMIIFAMISFVLETMIRVCLCPMAIVSLIIMQLIGFKSTINSDLWHTIWRYSMPWDVTRCYLTQTVVNYLAPKKL